MFPTLRLNGHFSSPKSLFDELDWATHQLGALFHAQKGLESRRNLHTIGKNSLNENDEAFELTFSFSGLKRDEIEITINDNHFIVEAKKEVERPEGYEVIRQERHPIHYWQKFNLPKSVNGAAITAEFKDGLLTVTLPKRPEVRPRQIEIK